MGAAAYLAAMAELAAGRECENLVALARVGSTNQLARRIAVECLKESARASPCLVAAWEQTAGRGRQGNRWQSPPGAGVYATWVEPLEACRAGGAELASAPLLAGVGLCRAVDRHLGRGACRLKWPNDLLVGEGKIGGILIEAVSHADGEAGKVNAVLVGFGVNCGGGDEGQAPPGSTSLAREGGWTPGPAALAALTWELLASLRAELSHLGDEAYAIAGYRALSAHRPGETLSCRLGGEVVEGVFRGFDSRGFLRLEAAGQERLLSAGEILEP